MKPRVHLHPANRARHDHKAFGQHMADKVTGFMGSWRFLGLQTVVILGWVALNVVAVVLRWDPYPFILLNLVFSVQAAYASPLILLAQNVQTEHDRAAAEEDYKCNAESLRLLNKLVAGQGDLKKALDE